MKKFLARLILAFAKFITLPLNSMRRRETRAIACDFLAPVHAVDTKRGKLIFDTSSRWSFRAAWFFHESEPETLAWIDGFSDEACFWDIGANVGVFSLYAALDPTVRVLAFEPAAASYTVLNKNIELNELSNRISAYCVALCDESQLAKLNMANTASGRSMHGFGTERDQFDRAINTKFRQGAVGFSVDDFVSLFSPPLPTHVKIDVDGLEPAILRGGRDTFSISSVRSMLVEIEGDSVRSREIADLMTGFGFTTRPKGSVECRNVIFDRSAL